MPLVAVQTAAHDNEIPHGTSSLENSPLPQRMLIENDAHQTRVAILEEGQLAELFIERKEHLGVVGNVYKGRVNRVLPGMQAAFVDIGLDRDAFLYVSDVADPLARMRAIEGDDPARARDGSDGDDGSQGGETGEAANEDPATNTKAMREPPPHAPIEELLRPGQDLVVQVLKDALPNKGARVSTQVTLPGRHVVLLPGAAHLGVSRRIEDEAEREQLRALLEELRPPSDGLIARTVGVRSTREEMAADIGYLGRLWEGIQRKAERVRAPAMVHRDLSLHLRVLRDFLTRDFSELWVSDEGTLNEVKDFLAQVQPRLLDRVRLASGSGGEQGGLFERFRIEEEIEAALRNKVWLRSGGHIVIHQTEALVAIDVNTGRYVGSRNLQETVLTTNLEAVREIVRQIRLRNLGGIIVIDLIDMEDRGHAERVFQSLTDELAKDRAKHKVLSISEFGLVELTRKRSRPSLERLLMEACPHCHGTGRVKSLATLSLELRQRLLRRSEHLAGCEVTLRLHPDLARALQTTERRVLDELERELSCTFAIESDNELPRQRFDVTDT